MILIKSNMEGSSESNSRGLNTSGVSEFLPTERMITDRSKSFSHIGHVRSLLGSHMEDNLRLDNDSIVRAFESEDVSLRQWLDIPDRSVDAFECFHVFRQIVEIVNVAHSQGIVVHNVRPSCFVMSSFNHVSFIESASCSDSGSDEESPKERTTKSQEIIRSSRKGEFQEKKQPFPMKQILAMEMSWYTSPEEDNSSSDTCASDVYRLGVLLFELFCPVSSREEKSRTMSNLRHRVLPPQILLNCPKEASFCLWLLHPEPSYRPSMSELLQSEFINEPRENLEEREAAIELRDRIEEQDLLLEFLMLIQQRKDEVAGKLRDTISLLSSDIDQVVKRQLVLKQKGNDVHSFLVSRKRIRQGVEGVATEENEDNTIDEEPKLDETLGSTLLESSRLMRNLKKLESVYFATRYRQIKAASEKPLARYYSALSSDGRTSEKSSVSNPTQQLKDPINESRQGGWIDPFLEGLCKYLTFSKLRVKADLKQGDLLNSSNLICAIGFDRDGEFFATAGVNKKIKIFECESIINDGRDIHYPVVELACRSKLSGICWNSYIKSQIASSNFEGVVQVWDVARSQLVTEMKEHEKRVWSIDIPSADPTLLASGSDDGSVKLWSINQGMSIGTIKTKANVCCVQFPSDSGRSIAFGSADHKVYYYDLRHPKLPLCTMMGHTKTVSYVRFVDSSTLVSSSTDNTLKLWDLSMSNSCVNEKPVHSFMGHTNNFVGLSVSDGYIATGSETNEVFVYHKAFPMPVLSYNFKTIDPVSGLEIDDASQFISSVCWRGHSSTIVAANSTGNIKILEMV
ncbi:protein SPA1-RELATED 4 isoform X2 [Eutrema salsugineum]|uniref:protein SPA1-RELATED 4 isoform X2 n=1 Tax=Eutrema salsugineum TaxID=72664 RepID=UPI000CED3F50|nr:protein SPA1-RELATED 4 isoform X2 [Eutrema salsugineum]